MRQIQIHNGQLQVTQVPIPIPSKHQVLIKVSAIGVNRGDLLQVQGLYPAPNGSNVPGLEVSGYEMQTGHRVCALLESGGYSEYVVADERHIFEIPPKLDFINAAALPEALTTSYMALVDKGGLDQAGACVVIHGGSSGIGTMAIQVAKLEGAYVIATAGNTSKLDFCKQYGADAAFIYSEDEWVQAARARKGADLVLDVLGGPYLPQNIKALGLQGRVVVIAVMGGSIGELPMGALLMKNAMVIGTTLRSQSAVVKARYLKAVSQSLLPQVLADKIKVHIDSTYPLQDAAQAHARLLSRKHTGKIILLV